MAAEGGHEEVVAFLLDCGARSSRKSASGRTPLMAAASGGGFLRVVRTLLEHQKGQGLDLRDSRGETALYKAAKAGHADMVYFLLIRGARADLSDQSRNTPLMAACSSGFLGVVRTLLEHQEGQGLDSKDAEGRTALFKAAENGHEEVVVFLLSRGAQANIERRRWEGNTPLMAAYNDGFLGVVRVIIHHLMDEGLVVVGGTNALHIAVERGDEEIVGLLLACGADVSGAIRTVSSAKTALGIASEKGRLSVVKLLLEHLNGQRLDTRDGNGSTALHLACQNDTPEVVRALLVAGADPTIRNNFGQTPRAIAEQSRHSRCARAFPVSVGLHTFISASSGSNFVNVFELQTCS
jgi:ankyrin repeat protein